MQCGCGGILGVPYEWQQNIPMARNAGLTDEQIALIAMEGPVTGLDLPANLICRATDEISRQVAISDAALAQMLETFGAQLIRMYILEIAWFNLLARFLVSTRVPLEDGDVIGDRTSPL
jgi:hypothetical protein